MKTETKKMTLAEELRRQCAYTPTCDQSAGKRWLETGDDGPQCCQCRAAAALEEKDEALRMTLVLLDTMTSDDFAHGKDKPIREACRAALRSGQEGA